MGWLTGALFCAGPLSAAEDRPPVTPFKPWNEVKPGKLPAFAPPRAERVALSNGMVLFLLEDHELPLLECAMTVRTGQIYEPAEKTGLAAITAEVMRSGGTAALPGDKLDEILDDLAASVSVGIGLETGSAGFSCLQEDFERVFGIFEEVLRRPAFPQAKLDLALTQARTRIAKRNDNPTAIANREFTKALYARKDGPLSPWARQAEYETLNAITRQDLVDFHRAHFHPQRFILSLTGAFNTAAMRARIEKAFLAWPAAEGKLPVLPDPSMRSGARLLFVERPHLDQTAFILGHPLELLRENPDFSAVLLMNEVFSGSMSARLFTEIRTRKGLAYSVSGRANILFRRPGQFSCSCRTRTEQTLEALEALREEVVRLREHGVTSKELEEARESLLNSFVFECETAEKVAESLRTFELHGYPLDFSQQLVQKLGAITVEDVKRVAKKYIEPDKLLVLAVGSSASFPRPMETLGKLEAVDVSIPAPRKAPLVIEPEREARGRKILEAALEAAGGVKAFREIQTLRAGLVLHTGSFKLNTVMRVAVPDRVRADIAGPFGPITQIMAPQEAWQASGAWVKPIPTDEAQKNLRALTQTDLGIMQVLAAGQEGYNLQALDPVRDGERVLLGVVLESKTLGRIQIFFDEKTLLMAKLRYPLEGAKEAEKLFSGHTSFGPLKLARHIEDSDPKAKAKAIEMTALQINPPLDAKIFEKPEQAIAPEVMEK